MSLYNHIRKLIGRRCISTQRSLNKDFIPDSENHFIKQSYMINGKYLHLLDNKRMKWKEEKRLRRKQLYENEIEERISKRVLVENNHNFEKGIQIKNHIGDKIEELLSNGKTLNQWIHPLFFKVNDITLNPDLTRAFVTWKVVENNIYSKERLEESISKDLARFSNLVKKSLNRYRHINIRFALKASDIDGLEAIYQKMEEELK